MLYCIAKRPRIQNRIDTAMAYKGKKITVVVPAHNEERLLGSVLDGIPEFVDRVIVVDDASTDGTAEVAYSRSSDRISLIRHTIRRGVGAAIRTGYRNAIEQNADSIVVMAGDAQMDPKDLPALLEPIVTGSADYAKGNRLADRSRSRAMPSHRLFGNRILSRLTRFALGTQDIHDSQCGYTAVTAGTLSDLLTLPWCNGYGYPNEVLCNLVILKKQIADVPVHARYGDETSGIKIPAFTVKMLFILTRCAWRRLLSRLHG